MRIYRDQVIENMKKEETVVLNILSKSDYRKLHIQGSENLPLGEDSEAFSKEVEGKYGKKKMFSVYGDHFGLLDSFLAAKALEDHGLSVLNYSGGVQEWYRSGLPVGGTQITPEPAVGA
jgi:rhodanese-related sulfurtransferase